MGSLLASQVVPYGLKGLSRGTGRVLQRNSKAKAKAEWLQTFRGFISHCEDTTRGISVKSRSLTSRGNSSKLLLKLNRARRATNPPTALSSLAAALEEMAQLDLVWNVDIPSELSQRAEADAVERSARTTLKASSPELVRLSRAVDVFNRTAIAEGLRDHAIVSQSILGAMDALTRQGPDGNRQSIASCRSSLEALTIRLGGNGDWKESLKRVLPSATDQRAVVGAWNYLSGKGAHGGHDPTRAEAEYGLRITIATIDYLMGKSSDITDRLRASSTVSPE